MEVKVDMAVGKAVTAVGKVGMEGAMVEAAATARRGSAIRGAIID